MLLAFTSRICPWGVAVLLLASLPACMRSPETDTAFAFIRAMAEGDFPKAESYFAEDAASNDVPESTQVFWNDLTGRMGAFKSITTFMMITGDIAGIHPESARHKMVTVSITCQFESGSADIWMSFSEDGKVTSLYL